MTPVSDTVATEVTFHLPKSGLTLNGTRLIRRKETGELVAEFDLSELSGIEFRAFRESGMIVFSIGAIAISVGLIVGFHPSLLAWIAGIIIAVIGAFLWLGSLQHNVTMVANKAKIQFPILDSQEDGHAFVLMLQKAHRKHSRH